MQPITKMWYSYLEEGKLMGLKCKRCGAVHFPPFPICRDCSGMEMEWVEVSGEALVDEIALVAVPDVWFQQWAPYYFAYAHTAEGAVFDSMLFGIGEDPQAVFDTYKNAEGKLKVKMEIQQREGYSYPVYRYVPEG
ncbi:zinc ribbon domain-containing protein [Eubacteriales bacterium OttesenSCG-928-N14]|nr:zinc ribbon domain-containing protein [Eubacteriales bacterium OttesenSCG-928-N14]